MAAVPAVGGKSNWAVDAGYDAAAWSADSGPSVAVAVAGDGNCTAAAAAAAAAAVADGGTRGCSAPTT